jgi:hypothetical protein
MADLVQINDNCPRVSAEAGNNRSAKLDQQLS